MKPSEIAYARYFAVQELLEHDTAQAALLSMSERVATRSFRTRELLELRAKALLAEAKYQSRVEEYGLEAVSAAPLSPPAPAPQQSESRHDG